MDNSVIIYTPSLARHLFKKGFKLVDFKADRKNYVATVFFFENTEKIWEEIEYFKEKRKESRYLWERKKYKKY